MERISSKNNGRIKMAAKLLSSSGERRERGLFVIEGARLCRDAYLSSVAIEEIFVTADALRKYFRELDFIYDCKAACFEISGDAALKLSDTKNPQGIFCVAKTLDKKVDIDKIKHNGFYAALENIQTPANFGAVCRTAEALGIDGVIAGGGCDIYNPKALRSAMGATFRLPIIETGDLPGLLRSCAQNGMNCYACVPDSDAIPLTEADFSRGGICVIGNEGAGISRELTHECTGRLTIPMRGRAESLNAAGAAAIVIWEMQKQMAAVRGQETEAKDG